MVQPSMSLRNPCYRVHYPYSNDRGIPFRPSEKGVISRQKYAGRSSFRACDVQCIKSAEAKGFKLAGTLRHINSNRDLLGCELQEL